MAYTEQFWKDKKAVREQRWQEDADEYASKISRCVDVIVLIHAMQDIWSKPPVPRGFLRGGLHERTEYGRKAT